MKKSEDVIYIYCVTKKAPGFISALKEGDNSVYIIPYRGLYAVAAKISSDEFSDRELNKKMSDMKWIEEKALRHEQVIETVMRNCTVIPFKFATIFKTEENVKAMLRERHGEFKEILERLDGKEEWGIKMYCSLDHLKASLIKEDDAIKRIEEDIKLSSAGKAYLLKKKRDELIENILNKKINEYGQDSFEMLKALSVDARINKILPKEVTGRKDKMILNSTFLIDKSKIKYFIDVIDYLKSRYNDKGLSINCTGPWPPYNFCSIKPVPEILNRGSLIRERKRRYE